MSTPTRLLAISLSIATIFLFGIRGSLARIHPMGPTSTPPRYLPWAPVPILMPIVWHSAIELRLTPPQEKSLLKWRGDQMRAWTTSRRQFMRDNRALRNALLDSKPENALNTLVAAVHNDQARMLDTEIDQVEFLHRLLTPQQWKRLIALYRFRMMRGGWHRRFIR